MRMRARLLGGWGGHAGTGGVRVAIIFGSSSSRVHARMQGGSGREEEDEEEKSGGKRGSAR
jgi:hypothetical protein